MSVRGFKKGKHLLLPVRVNKLQVHASGLPDLSWYNIPKRGKDIPKNVKYTKWQKNAPNIREIDQIDI
jgi:hypothetical protein